MSGSETPQNAADLKRRVQQLSINYAQQALDDLENLPVSADPKAAAQKAETWGEIIDTLRKISDQLDR